MPRKEPQPTRPTVPGYKFSAKKTGLLPWKWATQRLKKSRQYWIATTRPDGAPHLMIIWGIWLEDAFWFSTGASSRKARNLAGSPKCVIGTDNAAQAALHNIAFSKKSFCAGWISAQKREVVSWAVNPQVSGFDQHQTADL